MSRRTPGVFPIAEPGPRGEGPHRPGSRRGGPPRRDRTAAGRSPLRLLTLYRGPREAAHPGQSGGQYLRVRHGFVAIGVVLREFGISVTAYLASASIIGLAVGFGPQGLVQDVVTGLTVVFSNLFDVGDMVEIGGQTGIVQELGMRFAVLTNFMGARGYIPNRTIANVVTYPRGYVRELLDVNLPAAAEAAARAEHIVRLAIQSAHEQFPGILVTSPSVEGRFRTSSGRSTCG
ncbi:MAG TPA: mechanosensitive ion channel domain-containing protein [Deferrisomatales bacterium]|nr:mechanosensitive ion channel domain-containing protein [Deferrisomatales bacterium]